MAGDWIKWVKGLSKRREVIVLARKMGISRREAACACMEMWEWADDETVNGFVQGATGEDIDAMLGLPGFALAIQASEVGWLKVNNLGLSFPKWERNNGETAKRRAAEASKKRRQRELGKGQPSHKCPAGVPARAGPETEESERKRKEPPPPPPDQSPYEAVVAAVLSCGASAGAARSAINVASLRKVPPEVLMAIVNFWKQNQHWGVGALVSRIEHSTPKCDPGLGWPQKYTMPDNPRATAKALETAKETKAYIIVRDGRRAKKPDGEIAAELASAGLEWPK